ncbi:MAG: ATP-binding protein [Candidatus Binataceae bacterium]
MSNRVHALTAVATHFASIKTGILARWCELVRADSGLPERRLTFSDAELQDHLPALLDSLVEALRGADLAGEEVERRGRRHGHTRRLHAFTLAQLIWEFAIFRKLLREALEELAASESHRNLFTARELIMELTDRSERGSVQQYLDEANQERDAARNELRAANDNKDRFLAVLSHELRNPLAAVRTAVLVLRAGNITDAQRESALRIIDRQTRYQTRLVDDLLDVNRIAQGKIQLDKRPLDFGEALQNAVDTMMPAIEAKEIDLRFARPEKPIRISADPLRIEQIVTNLLSNSVKFTPSHGSIAIELTADQETAALRIQDTGAGLDDVADSHIFDLFSQVKNGAEGGLGIGLWLARSLTELHGGTIDISSQGRGKGTQFNIHIPLLRDSAIEHPSPTRVLIVEDDPDQAELFAIALSAPGIDVVAANDAATALKMASHRRYDAYILDLGLPDMHGGELAERILDLHGERRPLIVALSGFSRTDKPGNGGARETRFDYQLLKPVDVNEVQRILLERDWHAGGSSAVNRD